MKFPLSCPSLYGATIVLDNGLHGLVFDALHKSRSKKTRTILRVTPLDGTEVGVLSYQAKFQNTPGNHGILSEALLKVLREKGVSLLMNIPVVQVRGSRLYLYSVTRLEALVSKACWKLPEEGMLNVDALAWVLSEEIAKPGFQGTEENQSTSALRR
jgi:hypothetical protein